MAHHIEALNKTINQSLDEAEEQQLTEYETAQKLVNDIALNHFHKSTP